MWVSVGLAEEKKLEDTAELSYVQTSGNTDIVTFSGKNKLVYHFLERWAGTWNVGALFSEVDGEDTAERYYTDLRLDFKATEHLFYYGLGGWLRDEFAGFENRYFGGLGAGYHFLTGDKHFLSAEAGLNYASEEYIDGTEEDFYEGRIFGNYTYALNPKTKFSQDLEYLDNFDDSAKYKIKSVSSVTTMLTDQFSLKLAYEIFYNNEPTPDTLETTDTIFSAALVVNL
jgi:putative salt-induced outer membrane protein